MQISLFADNNTDCRRTSMLNNLGELFDSKQCSGSMNSTCDKCFKQSNPNNKDITDDAAIICKCIQVKALTLLQTSQILVDGPVGKRA